MFAEFYKYKERYCLLIIYLKNYARRDIMKNIGHLCKKCKTIFKNIGFMFQYSWRLAKLQYLFAIVNTIMTSIQPFVLLIIPSKIIDELAGLRRWEVTLRLILLFIVIETVIGIINIIISYISSLSQFRSNVRNQLEFEKLWLHMDYENLENSNIRDLGTRIQNNISALGFISTISSFIVNLIQLASYAYIIATVHPLIIVAILMFIFVSSRIAKKREEINFKYQPIITKFSRRFSYLFETMVSFDYGKEIRINDASTWLINRYNFETDEYMKHYSYRQKKELGLNIFEGVEAFLQTLIMYGYCAYKAIAGLITVGHFSMYLGAITAFTGSFTGIVSKLSNFVYLSNHVDDFRKYLEIASSKNEKADYQIAHMNFNEHVIEFCDVSFKYPNTDRYVLKHINIKINSGEKLSVVGYNGAGKSTFIKLINRLYTPSEGKILYNGIDISSIDYDEYRNLIAVVFQDYRLFSMPIWENIVMNRVFDENTLETSIEKSGLTKKIQTLPNGRYTQLTKEFTEDGIEFSGGEAQKLACARAYYRNSPIVILDEPTASLDPVAENQLYERFNSIISGKTAIYISHRLASVKFCDRVAVFSNGEIVECGTHDALMKHNGIYAEMFLKQSEYYVEKGSVR